MIVEEIFGDMFKTDCQTITIPVNIVGVMGAGLANYTKKRWPSVEVIYKRHCSRKLFKSKLLVVPIEDDKQLLFLPTKNHWSENSNEWLVNRSLEMLAHDYKELGIKTLAIPKIACGRGNMDFDEIKALIYKHLDPIPVPVKIYT